MKRNWMALGLAALIILATAGIGRANQVYAADAYPGEAADDANMALPDEVQNPGREYVHVDAFPISVEIGVPGFWRLRVRPGYSWADGYWNDDRYIPGHWRPLRMRGSNWAWVPGHWNGGFWVNGRWRPLHRTGYAWVDGHWTRSGEWIEGYWRPLARAPEGVVWEPGYWGPNGWVEGFWRPSMKIGFTWINGEWDGNGRWVIGHWMNCRPQEVWVRSYWDRRGHFYPGRLERPGHPEYRDFRPGHYDRRGDWVEPRWREVRRMEENRQVQEIQRERRGGPNEQKQLNSIQRSREDHQVHPAANPRQNPRPEQGRERGMRQERRPEGGQVVPLGGRQEPMARPGSGRGAGKSNRDDREKREAFERNR